MTLFGLTTGAVPGQQRQPGLHQPPPAGEPAAQAHVDPQLLPLSNGVLLLSSGRPGLLLWASADGGATWTRLSLAGAHNSLVGDAAFHFAPEVVNATCDYPYSCDQQASPPQTRARPRTMRN